MKKLAQILAEEGLTSKKARRYNWRDVADMDPEKAMQVATDIRREAGRKANEYWRMAMEEAVEAQDRAERIRKAWDRWDWDELASLHIVDEDTAEFVKEVLASYTP